VSSLVLDQENGPTLDVLMNVLQDSFLMEPKIKTILNAMLMKIACVVNVLLVVLHVSVQITTNVSLVQVDYS